MKSGCWPLAVALLLIAGVPTTARAQHEHAGLPSDGRTWGSFRKLLREAEPAFADPTLLDHAADALPGDELRSALAWSGEAGFLVWVRIQIDAQDAARGSPLGPPILLAAGETPLDAAVAGFFEPPYLTAAAPNMRFAEARSFFVWVTRSGASLRFARLSAAESLTLRRTAANVLADPPRRTARLGARRVRIMSGIRERLARVPSAVAAISRLDAALADYRKANTKLASVENNQDQAWRWQQSVERALQRVEIYGNVLTLDGLKDQAASVLSWDWPGFVAQLRGAKSPQVLGALLTTERNELRNRLSTTDLPGTRRLEAQAYSAFLEAVPDGEHRKVIADLLPARDSL